MIVRRLRSHSTRHETFRSRSQHICPECCNGWRHHAATPASSSSRKCLRLFLADLEIRTELLRRCNERTHRGVIRRVFQLFKVSGSGIRRQIRVQEHLQFAMLYRVPLPQRFRLLCRRSRRNVAALHGKKSWISHGRPVRGFHVTPGQLRQIDFVKDRERGEFGHGVGARASRAGDQPQGEKSGERNDPAASRDHFNVHGR